MLNDLVAPRVDTHDFGFLFADNQSHRLGIHIKIVEFLLKIGRCGKDGNIVSKIKVFKVREESPLYSTRAFRSCLAHHPVDCNKKEDRRVYTALGHSGFYCKCFCNEVSEDDTAFEVIVEHLNMVDNLRWYSICLEDLP